MINQNYRYLLTMISTNALSLFLLKHDQNGVFNRNLLSIQDLMRSDESAGTKFKRVCTDSLHLTLLTKTATPGEMQVTFGYTSVGNNSLEETVTAFALVGSLEYLVVASIDAKRDFTSANKKSRLPVTEFLLHDTNITLMGSMKLWVGCR